MELCAWWFLADRAKKPVLVCSRCCVVASYPVTGVRQPRDKHSKTPCPVRQPRDACRKTPNPIRRPRDCAQENIKSHQRASPSEAGPGVLWICSLGWFLHRGCCHCPAELWLVPAEVSSPCGCSHAGCTQNGSCQDHAIFINPPRVPVCRALPNAFLWFDRGSEGACKWYFCKTSAACALSGVSWFIASCYPRYEEML